MSCHGSAMEDFIAEADGVTAPVCLIAAFTALYSLYLDIRHRGWKRDRAGH